MYGALAYVQEDGKSVHVEFGLSDKDGKDTIAGGTVSLTITDASGAKTCETSIPFSATTRRSELSGTYPVDGTFAKPCTFGRTDARQAKVELTTDAGAHVESSVAFTTIHANDTAAAVASAQASAAAAASAAAHPTPWSRALIEAALAALPEPTAPDESCPDEEIRKLPRHERVQLDAVDADDLRAAVGRKASGRGCGDVARRSLAGPIPPLLIIDVAQRCTTPRAIAGFAEYEGGSYSGVVAVFDTRAKKVLCHARFVATSSASVTGRGATTTQEMATADFIARRAESRKAALQGISRFVEDPVGGFDDQELYEGRVY